MTCTKLKCVKIHLCQNSLRQSSPASKFTASSLKIYFLQISPISICLKCNAKAETCQMPLLQLPFFWKIKKKIEEKIWKKNLKKIWKKNWKKIEKKKKSASIAMDIILRQMPLSTTICVNWHVKLICVKWHYFNLRQMPRTKSASSAMQ